MPKLRFQTASLRLRRLAGKAVCKQKMCAVGWGVWQAAHAVSGSWERRGCVVRRGTRASPWGDTLYVRFGMGGGTGRLKECFWLCRNCVFRRRLFTYFAVSVSVVYWTMCLTGLGFSVSGGRVRPPASQIWFSSRRHMAVRARSFSFLPKGSLISSTISFRHMKV